MYSKIVKILNISKDNIIELNSDKFIIKIIQSVDIICKSLRSGNKVIFAGNGGSAADANHLSAEMLGKFLKIRKSLNANSLSANSSSITAIANDFGYENIFRRQLEGLGKRGDVVIALSTSMRSKNIIKLLNLSLKLKCRNIIFASEKSNKYFSKKVDVFFDFPANRVDRIQEIHMLVGHIICELVENKMSSLR
jgi:D-sedoheptulose 7-phosphate isomerase